VTSPFNLDGRGTRSRFCCQDILLPLAFRRTLQLAISFDTASHITGDDSISVQQPGRTNDLVFCA